MDTLVETPEPNEPERSWDEVVTDYRSAHKTALNSVVNTVKAPLNNAAVVMEADYEQKLLAQPEVTARLDEGVSSIDQGKVFPRSRREQPEG